MCLPFCIIFLCRFEPTLWPSHPIPLVVHDSPIRICARIFLLFAFVCFSIFHFHFSPIHRRIVECTQNHSAQCEWGETLNHSSIIIVFIHARLFAALGRILVHAICNRLTELDMPDAVACTFYFICAQSSSVCTKNLHIRVNRITSVWHVHRKLHMRNF